MLDELLASASDEIDSVITDSKAELRNAIELKHTADGLVFGSTTALKKALKQSTQKVADRLDQVLSHGSKQLQAHTVTATHGKYAALTRQRGREPVAVDLGRVTRSAQAARADGLEAAAADYGTNAFDDLSERFDGDVAVDAEDEWDDPEDLLVEVASDRMKNRALLVCATEWVVSQAQAAQETLEEIDDPNLSREWNAEDEMCADCEDLDAEVVAVDEPFTGGAEPPLHPNCRCTIEPFVRD